ncbi:unnamed protein product, partial [Soboliphyme baturini]|uniref:EF-hand domain-containing protein n=1 Tax=Soboliphyme baturini TaxID=241478 RepID=A0A183J1X7_9BILA
MISAVRSAEAGVSYWLSPKLTSAKGTLDLQESKGGPRVESRQHCDGPLPNSNSSQGLPINSVRVVKLSRVEQQLLLDIVRKKKRKKAPLAVSGVQPTDGSTAGQIFRSELSQTYVDVLRDKSHEHFSKAVHLFENFGLVLSSVVEEFSAAVEIRCLKASGDSLSTQLPLSSTIAQKFFAIDGNSSRSGRILHADFEACCNTQSVSTSKASHQYEVITKKSIRNVRHYHCLAFTKAELQLPYRLAGGSRL